MELALNLSWLVVTCLLFASVGVAHRRGRLRLSFKLALGCTAVLALLLFPVISMTDDLQQAQMLCETISGHLAGTPNALPVSSTTAFAAALVLLSLLLLALAGSVLVLLARLLDACRSDESRMRQRPCAVRPPPFLFCMPAA